MLVLFLATMVVFAVVAGWLGWRLAQQDRVLQGQQIRERLESAADLVAADLRRGLSRLENQIEALSLLDVGDLSAAVARAAETLPDDALLVLVRPAGVSAYPAGRLVYHPKVREPPALPTDTFAKGEAFEFRTRQYDRAIATFRRQSESVDESVRAGALLRLARVYRKAGRTQDALATYGELATLGGTPVEGLPAELLARHARCVLLASQARRVDLRSETRLFQEQLLAGAWTIDRSTFLHYTAEAETFVRLAEEDPEARDSSESSTDANRATPLEVRLRQALALAAGFEAMWQERDRLVAETGSPASRMNSDLSGHMQRELEGTSVLVLWRQTGDTMIGLVGGPGLVWKELVAPLLPLLGRQAAGLILADGAGRTLLSAGLPGEPVVPGRLQGAGSRASGVQSSRVPTARRTGLESGLPWELQILSANPAADRERLTGRRRLLLIGSALIVLLMAAGTYFTTRVVARELAVARLQSEFVSAVSHDFRTPLTSLRQVTDALADGRVAEDRRAGYYDIQVRAIDRLHRLVEGLLDFGRMEAGAREFDLRPIRARQWVEGVVSAFQTEVEKQGYRVELSWNGADRLASEEPMIEGDEPALTRALWNLLDNAVKYSLDCKTIWVDGRVTGTVGPEPESGSIGSAGMDRWFVVSVSDRGLGVDPAERRKIFSKFVRGAAAAVSSSTGTGLGLAIVERIVRAHDGEVEVDSRQNQGSVFRIRLPLRDAV